MHVSESVPVLEINKNNSKSNTVLIQNFNNILHM